MIEVLWSDYRMPDGSLPGPDDVVVVDSNVRLILDEAGSPAQVEGLIIYGEFTVEETDTPLELVTDWAIAAGDGSFRVGTAEDPYEGEFELTLAGKDNSFDLDLRDYPDGSGIEDGRCPVTGGEACQCDSASNDSSDHDHPHVIENNNAFLMAMGDGASISIHVDDAEKQSWAQLDGTAEKGATELTFAEATGWEVGDRIAIASTDFDMNQAEERTIVAVSDDGKTITLDQPLEYMHYGEIDTYDDPDGDVHQLDMRAEVALLSRDVTIQGDVDYDESKPLNEQEDQYGGHTMVMHGGEMYMSGVELAYMGQAGILGRYPAHWHESGDVTGQYIENSSVHHSFNKGITVHNTQGALVSDNVVYETISHSYYLEQSDTHGNDLIDNLAINARDVGRFGTIRNANDDTPSNFYTTNADNTWTGNHAAGSDANGFYFRLSGQQKFNFGTVDDNAVHSVENRGVYVHHQGMAQDGNPQGSAEQPQKADDWEISGLTVYKSGLGVYSQATNGTFTDSAFAELGSNGRFRLNTTIEDSLIVGRADNIGNPETQDERDAGRSLPGGDGDFQGWQLYDGPGSLSNVMFDGFTEPGDRAIEQSNAIHKSSSFGLKGITWGEDVTEENKFAIGGGGNAYGNDSASRGLVDVDGSISGVEGAMIYQSSSDRSASEGFNAGAEYQIVRDWGAIITTSGEQSATLTVDRGGTPDTNTGKNHGLPFSNLNATRSDGEYANGIRQQVPLFDGYTYELDFGTPEQDNFRLYLGDADWGQSFIVSLGDDIPTDSSFTVDNPNNSESRPAREVSSMEMLEASHDTAVFRDADGVVHVKLVAEMAHGYLWPQPGAAIPGSLNSGVTVLVNTAAEINLDNLVFDDPEPGETLGPPPYAEGQAPQEEPINVAPVAQDDQGAPITDGETVRVDVLANDADPDGDPLSVEILGAPTGGSARVDGQNRIVFTPEEDFTGEAEVYYQITDGKGGANTATLRIAVTAPEVPADPAPTPGDGGETVLAFVEAGGSVLIQAESYEGLPEGWVTKSNYDDVAAPDLGALGGDNNFVMWQGADQSEEPGEAVLRYYVVIETTGLYEFELRDQPGTDRPEVGGDTWVKINGAQFYGFDADDDSAMYPLGAGLGTYPDDAQPLSEADSHDGWLRYQSTNRSTHWGTGGHVNDTGVRDERHDIVVEFDEPGVYVIELAGATPSSHAIGSFGLVNRDVSPEFSLQGEESARLEVSLDGVDQTPLIEDEPENQAPTAEDDRLSLEHGGRTIVDVLANDVDPDGEALSITSVDVPDGLEAEILPGGIQITASDGFSGNAAIGYTISDGSGGTSAAEVLVSVAEPEPDPEPAAIFLELMDANSDQTITALEDGTVVTLTAEALAALTIKATTESDSVESITFDIEDGRTHTENRVPYALFGDNQGDLSAGNLGPGEHSLTVVAYDENRGNGEVLGERTITFEIVEEVVEPEPEPIAFSFDLIDTDADEEIGALEDGAVVTLTTDELAALSIKASADSDDVESVSFQINGGPVHIENFVPYALFGDRNGNYGAGDLGPGLHSLSVVAYDEDGGQGEALGERTIMFEIVEEADLLPELTEQQLTLPGDDEDRSLTIAAADLGKDPEGDALVIDGAEVPEGTMVEIAEDGSSLTITPEADFSGTVAFEVLVSEAGSAGRARSSTTIEVDIEPEPSQSIFSAALYTTEKRNDTEIIKIENGDQINASLLEDLGPVSFALVLNDDVVDEVGSVALNHDGKGRIENVEPYALFGNIGDNFSRGEEFELGVHEIEITVFSYARGDGNNWETTSFIFELV
ncbi:MAG: cadherin-like domain-containing protein [Pseudomonadota bacterium]